MAVVIDIFPKGLSNWDLARDHPKSWRNSQSKDYDYVQSVVGKIKRIFAVLQLAKEALWIKKRAVVHDVCCTNRQEEQGALQAAVRLCEGAAGQVTCSYTGRMLH